MFYFGLYFVLAEESYAAPHAQFVSVFGPPYTLLFDMLTVCMQC